MEFKTVTVLEATKKAPKNKKKAIIVDSDENDSGFDMTEAPNGKKAAAKEEPKKGAAAAKNTTTTAESNDEEIEVVGAPEEKKKGGGRRRRTTDSTTKTEATNTRKGATNQKLITDMLQTATIVENSPEKKEMKEMGAKDDRLMLLNGGSGFELVCFFVTVVIQSTLPYIPP
ncbi:hypothetical protein KSP39_PZI021935 [Platanthera zijinensis]|uniref:Uncharacterized protein n=1 Tax=Platanthera zijinensis TaxID=2320716 RepID=A0AAP0AXS9_9ASPA